MRRRAPVGAGIVLALLCGSSLAAGVHPDDRVTKGHFTALALIITDPNWKREWQTSPQTIPKFKTVDVIRRGQRGIVLTFFSGATLKNGVAKLVCDLRVHQGDHVQSYPKQTCYSGKLTGSASSVYITTLGIEFEPEANDGTHINQFDIGITDANSGVRLPLSVSVLVDAGKGHS